MISARNNCIHYVGIVNKNKLIFVRKIFNVTDHLHISTFLPKPNYLLYTYTCAHLFNVKILWKRPQKGFVINFKFHYGRLYVLWPFFCIRASILHICSKHDHFYSYAVSCLRLKASAHGSLKTFGHSDEYIPSKVL